MSFGITEPEFPDAIVKNLPHNGRTPRQRGAQHNRRLPRLPGAAVTWETSSKDAVFALNPGDRGVRHVSAVAVIQLTGSINL